MALGGGTFTAQNKVLPGSYINFVSAARATASMSDRGTAALPFVMDWGPEDQVITLTQERFQKESLPLLGYSYTHPQMQALREVFRNAQTLLCYRLNREAQKAVNTYAEAKYGGSRGNALTVVIQRNVDNADAFDVITLLEQSEVDRQTVAAMAELQDNDFVTFRREAELAETAGVPLENGTDGTGRTGENYQRFLARIEEHSFHALGCNCAEKEIVDLFVAFTKRMRDEVGVKFQTVVYRAENADYEGIISLENKLLHVDESLFGEFSLVYWVTGAAAACAVNRSNTNKAYDGEYMVDTAYTQQALQDCLKKGRFVLHKVGDQVRVLDDINSFVSFSEEKSEDFASNQTIRVLDQIGNDIAALFGNKYLGKVPNDESGRVSLWADIVKHHRQLLTLRAIENFEAGDITLAQGETRKSVVVTNRVTPVNAMTQLYMTTMIQ